MAERSYPSKLLLFGEYAVIDGGEALAIPYPKFSLHWADHKPADSETKQYLIDFLNWLKENKFSEALNLNAFESDLNKGRDVESNIPIGYGVGSSGALVAAVYDRYCKNKIDKKNLSELKLFLGSMENYFHTQSSGLDPLVSYLQCAIHVAGNELKIIPDKIIKSSSLHFELIDTGKKHQTSELVETFKERIGLPAYKEQFDREYLPLVKDCIKYYLDDDKIELKKLLYKLSQLQMTLFSFAIPSEAYQNWIMGLMFNNYLKLCGAGGGGFIISFTLE